MKNLGCPRFIAIAVLSVLVISLGIQDRRIVISQEKPKPEIFDVRDAKAIGDGKNLDSPLIQKVIDRAAEQAVKDGIQHTVFLPRGNYRSFSIQLKSNLIYKCESDAKIVAASPRDGDGQYNPPELNPHDKYQDFGHSHWQNSLIWGENIENIAIVGCFIDGKGLVKNGSESRTQEQNNALRKTVFDKTGPFGYPNPRDAVETGWANKAIAFKNSKNILIKDTTIVRGGHFAILLTGVDGLVINNTTVDTNRDGIDIDASSNVTIANSRINAPFDDGIVLKTSFALGKIQNTENIKVINCKFTGYDEGTMLDGTFKREYDSYSYGSANGRFKIGTESNGGFKNIEVRDCEFTYTRGLALEVVDGGFIDGFTATNNKMSDTTNSPIFIRLGNRARGPEGTGVGTLKDVEISNLTVTNTDSRYASIISGIPGHPIEGLKIKDTKIQYRGGGTAEEAQAEPPEKESEYPEPIMFGPIPASGFYIRHANGIVMENLILSFIEKDERPIFILDDVENFSLRLSPLFPDMILKGHTKLKKF